MVSRSLETLDLLLHSVRSTRCYKSKAVCLVHKQIQFFVDVGNNQYTLN